MASVSVRSYLAAGVAAVGVGAVALSPVQPLTPQAALAPVHAAGLAVNLAAAVDPITALVDTIEATGANLSTLVNNWAQGLYVDGTLPFPPNTGTGCGPLSPACNGNLGNVAGGYATGVPLPAIQQIIQNVVTYLGELPDIGAIAGQIFDNIGNGLGAPFAAGENLPGKFKGAIGVGLELLLQADNVYDFNQNVNATPYINLLGLGDISARQLGALLPVLAGPAYATLEPIINFATTPISGVLVGAIGPIVAPVLSVINSVSAVFDALSDSDFEGALFELVNAPVNAVSALLNGGPTLDLTGLVGLLGVELPDSIKSIGLKMGGLLSPGGVAFDSLAAVAGLGEAELPVAGLPVGPIGALLGLTNYVAKAITVTPPAPTASVRAAAGDAVSETPAAGVATLASEQEAADPEVQITAVRADDSVTPVVERAQDDPVPTKQRQARRAAAAAGDDNGSAARGSASSDAPAKSAAPKRSAR